MGPQAKFLEEIAEDDDSTEKSIFLINCGATDNLIDVLELKQGIRVFVIDSHRPVYHKNLTDLNQNVLVFLHEDEGDFDESDLQAMFSDDEGEDCEAVLQPDKVHADQQVAAALSRAT